MYLPTSIADRGVIKALKRVYKLLLLLCLRLKGVVRLPVVVFMIM